MAEAAGSGYPADLAAMSGTAGAADQPSGHAQPHEDSGRGYALAYHGEELVRSAAQVQSGDVLRVQLAEGEITAKVQ